MIGALVMQNQLALDLISHPLVIKKKEALALVVKPLILDPLAQNLKHLDALFKSSLLLKINSYS